MSNRRNLDAYMTPSAWATEVLLRYVSVRGYAVECCAGDGAIADVLKAHPGIDLLTNDIDPNRGAEFAFNAADADKWAGMTCNGNFDWVVTNPPFSRVKQILPLAYEHATEGVAMLLRLTAIEPLRSEKNEAWTRWLVAHPPNDQITLPRMSFTGDGKSDSVTCAWFVWYKAHAPQRIIIVPEEKTARPPLIASAERESVIGIA